MASLIGLEGNAYAWNSGHHVLFDPCAGEGEAVDEIRKAAIARGAVVKASVVACEMEELRYRALVRRCPPAKSSDQILHTDAFAVTWPADARASVLYLNPPYDTDPEYKRLEQRFLARFTSALAVGGGLLYVVPAATLAASARYLARHFTEIRCWRFPDPEYAAFSQVVLLARRTTPPLQDEPMAATIEGWARFPARLLPLPEQIPDPLLVRRGDYSLPLHRAGFDRIATLAAFRPWEGAPVGVDLSVGDLVGGRQFPTALPPKPAHLALALAAGHFNGLRIVPDAGVAGPPLLIKGMFEKKLIVLDEVEDEGEVKKVVRIEQPNLRISALRLDEFTFFEPRAGAELTEAREIESCTVADLIHRYGSSFQRLMTQQFPPLHDPADPAHQIRLPDLPRSPFRAQRHAIQASLKLIATLRDPKLLAEVGVGKSTIALYVWAALTPRYHAGTVAELERVGFVRPALPIVHRMLVVCPPHLLDTWQEEILGDGRKPGCAPWAKVQIVRTISDLHAEADIYVMSREAAKLGHGYQGITGRCPRCGAPIPAPDKGRATAEINAKERRRCRAVAFLPTNLWAHLAERLAAQLLPLMPEEEVVRSLTSRHRILRKRAERPAGKGPLDGDALLGIALAAVDGLVTVLGNRKLASRTHVDLTEAVNQLARAIGREADVADQLERIALRRTPGDRYCPFVLALEAAKSLRDSKAWGWAPKPQLFRDALGAFRKHGGWKGPIAPDGSRADAIGEEGEDRYLVCGEPLYQAKPEPRRYPLASYICRYMPKRFQLLVLDELHEYNNQGSAQEKAAHRLCELGMPVLGLTGSVMSGYASSLGPNWWAMDRSTFRVEFPRERLPDFAKRYGYQKFVYTRRENQRGGYGSNSDREEWNCRAAGEVPGVLPLFLLRYLLPSGVVVHKDELDVELPPMDEAQILLEPENAMDEELLAEYSRIAEKLMDQIAADMFSPMAGKLWGAMMELPSYLDRCSANQGTFRLSYPEECGGMLVTEGKTFPESYRTPKERALLNFLEEQLSQDRRSLVFLRHVSTGLPDRLMRVIRESGLTRKVVYLNAQRVPAAKRKQWITENVIDTETEVMIVNPNAVRTGLNNLVAFTNAWWHEIDPGQAQTYRQANGRLHRVGQTLPVHIRFPHYPGTAQAVAVDLVARKVTASLQVDGLDVQGALEAAGGESSSRAAVEAAMAMGRAIYERLKAARAAA